VIISSPEVPSFFHLAEITLPNSTELTVVASNQRDGESAMDASIKLLGTQRGTKANAHAMVKGTLYGAVHAKAIHILFDGRSSIFAGCCSLPSGCIVSAK
jgi:hypothetical protein